jgi:hypothetical protein
MKVVLTILPTATVGRISFFPSFFAIFYLRSFLFETGSPFVAQAGLKLATILPQPPGD